MGYSWNRPHTEGDKKHNALMEVVEEISLNMAEHIDELKAKLWEREMEIQELEAKLKEATAINNNQTIK